MGLLADAGEETILLTRFLDDESFDKALLYTELANFVARVEALFVHKGCLTVATSFTHAILVFLLEQPRTLFVNGAPRKLGGADRISPGLLDRAVQRLVAWVRLSKEVLRAEFPHFEVLQAFAAVDLRPASRLYKEKNVGDGERQRVVHLERLSKFLGLEFHQLKAELEDHRPIAQRFFDSGNVTIMDAWASAVTSTQENNRKRHQHPAKALSELLMRYAAYGGSTSGVERLFSTSHRSSG